MPGPMAPAGEDTSVAFPQGPLPLAVDLFMFGNWVDVTRIDADHAGVYARDGIAISRGRSAEGADVDPTSIRLTLNNRDGRFSPRNPTGLYYGQIGRNTPLRVRVGNEVRAVGEVSSWPSKWDVTGSDVWVPVEASGILRRLSQGASPLNSPYYRWILAGAQIISTVQDFPVVYWPCEEGSGATQFASAIGGGPLAISGTPELGDNSDVPGSDSLPTLSGSSWTSNVPAYTPAPFAGGVISYSAVSTVGFLLSVPAAGATDGAIVLRVTTTGTAARFDLVYALAGGGSFQISTYTAAGTLISTSGTLATGAVNGNPMQVDLQFGQDGPDIVVGFGYATVAGAGAGSGVTITTRTAGRVSQVRVNANNQLADATVGHLTVYGSLVSLAATGDADLLAITGYFGETAGTRIRRLCSEEGIPYTRDDQNLSSAMGAQRSDTILDLLRGCAAVDKGILYEPRGSIGLNYLSRQGLYNRAAAITLDYPSHEMSTLEPVDDDQMTRNDITVSRTGGSKARRVKETGVLSVQDPPDGVGRYDTSVEQNSALDSTLDDHAGWLLHLGTVDEARYPHIEMNLASPAFATNPALTQQVRDLDIGRRLDVTNPPAWLPPDDITQGVQGLTEQLGAYTWTVAANLTPESPWRVGVYDSGNTAALGTDPGFESGTNGAAASGFFGGPTPSVAQSSVTWVGSEGIKTLEITWDTGGQGLVGFDCTGLVPGREYTVYVGAYVQSGAPDVSLGVAGVTFGDLVSTKDTPLVLQVTWTALTATDSIQVIGQTPAGAGTKCYLDALGIRDPDVIASRYSSDGSTLAADATATATALSVATPAGPLWTTDLTAYPFDVMIGGERMVLRFAAGTTSPQTFAVVRSINGVVKPQTAGTTVGLWRPAVYAL
jgi:hypothetical protein